MTVLPTKVAVLLPPICSPSFLHAVLKNQPATRKCLAGDTKDCLKLASSIFAILTLLSDIREPAWFIAVPREKKTLIVYIPVMNALLP